MNCPSRSDFTRFIGALIGVAMGAFLALFLACLIFPAPDADFGAAGVGTLDWVRPMTRHEAREMGFYLLTLIAAGVFGYVGASRQIQNLFSAWAVHLGVHDIRRSVVRYLRCSHWRQYRPD
jgi:hypothetical protein